MVSVYVDGELSTSIDVSSLEADSSEVYTDIPLNGLAFGLHTIRVVADDASVIQELSALNNAMEQKLMVLKEDANVVTGIKQVGPGEISRDDYISSGWQMHILSGGTASATIVRGIVTDVASNGTIFYLPGIAVVSQGGLVQDVAVYEYGQIQVSGTAGDLHVYENGSIMVFSGGRITGTLTVGNGAVVSMDDGSILDFDLTQTMAGNAALVNDLSAIQGAPLYSLTVDTNLKPGKSVYSLAEGAGGFNSAISVVDVAGNELGTLSLGETVRIGDDDYTLSLTGSLLSVTVVAPVPLPVNLNGGPEKVSWEASGAEQYIVEFSTDSFLHVIRVITTENTVDMMDLPAGTYQWRVRADVGSEWAVGAAIVSKANSDTPKVLRSDENGNCDLFFAEANSTWENFYYARHVGSINDWTGTDEMVSASGKGRIQNLFFGSADPNVLCLTDSENGDALFVDDIYTELPEGIEKNLSRLCRIREVRAGAGDDIVDMTSQRFEYVGDGLTIRGGDGDDTIWANKGDNFLFGDAGNDRIVGASGDDVIAGGIGSDSMHGGGGKDTFTFCGNWGSDEVEQLETGLVTLWFASGSKANWNENTLTYTDGINSVTVSGVTANKITLKFGDDGSEQYAALASAGAFEEFTSQRIFEGSGAGILASL